MAAVPGKNWGVATLCRNRGVGDGFLFCCGTMGRFVAAVAGSVGEGVPVQKGSVCVFDKKFYSSNQVTVAG
jgi:uncharacterized membrane protein